ncbi:hypothetical protein PENSPDRAFT_757084 [Peniophora sp. CONT]|nr:hypothetical protein PENSPDRAFT_757084 [Peniophora sp. CONT]
MSTGRLKRKLDEQGVDYTSRRATENFCLIGTPLPPLEKSKDTGEYVPLWKQDVRDEKGRRRLHGAFTGGFSAGYFNSVGSKEGWTPTNFVSSRNERAKQKAARPEDFMDDEDLAEHREEQLMKGVHAQRDTFGATPSASGEDDSMAQSIQRALMPPPEDSPGMILLRKMGWRPGQGVGPRITWRQRKIQDILASGRSLNDVDIDALAAEEGEEVTKHMFAPRDTVAPILPRKKDAHGLGFVAGDGLGGRSIGVSKGPKLSSGFGLGALNEADDDDLDVYDSSLPAERTYMPYDAADREPDENIILSGRKGRTPQGPAHTTRTTGGQTFKDGSAVLHGFVLAAAPVTQDMRFPLPDIPTGWKPDPHRVWNAGKANDEPTNTAGARTSTGWRNNLSADERGSILGETPLPRESRSIFDYLSQKDRDRLQSATAGIKAPKDTAGATLPVETAPPESIPDAFTPAHTAAAALKGYMPFTNEPVKQARYVAYLRSQAEGAEPPRALPGQSASDLRKELSDYAKSAAVFKPVTGAMANRFTSAAAYDNGPKAVEGLYQPVYVEEDEEEVKRKEAEKRRKEEEREQHARDEEAAVEGSRAHAVKFGMYGALTREVTPWQPKSLLCKRFGVKDPNPDLTTETAMPGVPTPVPSSTSTWQPEQALKDADLATATGAAGSNVPAGGTSGDVEAGDGQRSLDNVGLGEDETQGRDTLTYVRPSMDIFKAIFASDDESDDEDEPPVQDVIMHDAPPAPINGSTTTATPAASSSAVAPAAPAHLRSDLDEASASYEPKPPPPTNNEPVDLATFKPTFTLRKTTDNDKTAKSKDKDRKRKAKPVVSFADEEDEGGLQIAPAKAKDKDKDRKKKKRRKEKEDPVDDESMWVEKPVPEAIKALETRVPADAVAVDSQRSRKRAVDFLD